MKKIIVDNLRYRYPTAKTLALSDISFSVEEGEFIGIVGANSSGKSTLCQALIGLVPHFYRGGYGGKVTVNGMLVKDHGVSELSLAVGMVFQNPFTQVTGSKLTVYEEIAFGLENMGISRPQMIERIDAALYLLNLYPQKDKNPFDLSGGQVQRMAIASVIAMQPSIIVLDEPTSQLDPKGSDEVFKAIENLSHQGMTVILVEHKMEKIAQYCDKMLVLTDGKITAFDSPAKIFSRTDLANLDIEPTVYTSICRGLNAKTPEGLYPSTLDEATAVLVECGL